jgi:hypothetical protein
MWTQLLGPEQGPVVEFYDNDDEPTDTFISPYH